MEQLIFASNNAHKIQEIQAAIGDKIQVLSLADAGINIDIPEPHDSLEANAHEKSRTVYKLTANSCFSEDTGLEVEALGGAPGVRSARYAGEERNPEKNIDKLLHQLEGVIHRKARFRTVISLIYNNQEYFFEGTCEGEIIASRRGSHGFGYDPVFVPKGSKRTFAEMGMTEKNTLSHRRKAADKLVLFLQQQISKTRTT
jgi:XTP/dITP diphosphohydrolase